MVWGAGEVVGNYQSGKGDPSIWLTGFVLTFFGVAALVFLGSVVWAFRARIVLHSDAMTVRGAFLTRVIRPNTIEGFRWLDAQLHVYLTNRQWPINLARFERPHMLNQWVFHHAEDLDAIELAEEDEQINRDLTLGATADQKEQRLAHLRKLVQGMNRIAYVAAVVGVVNALFPDEAIIEQVSVAVLVPMPIILDLVVLANLRHVRIDYREGTRYPEILSGTMACGIGLVLMSLLDNTTLLGNGFYQWFIPITLSKGLLWSLLESKHLREVHAQGWLGSTLTVIGFLVIPAFWVGGGVYEINKHLDRSEVKWNATEVVGKRMSRGKAARYYLKVAPWQPTQHEPPELTISLAQFKTIEPGAFVEIGVREGALAIPWVTQIRPAARKHRSIISDDSG